MEQRPGCKVPSAWRKAVAFEISHTRTPESDGGETLSQSLTRVPTRSLRHSPRLVWGEHPTSFGRARAGWRCRAPLRPQIFPIYYYPSVTRSRFQVFGFSTLEVGRLEREEVLRRQNLRAPPSETRIITSDHQLHGPLFTKPWPTLTAGGSSTTSSPLVPAKLSLRCTNGVRLHTDNFPTTYHTSQDPKHHSGHTPLDRRGGHGTARANRKGLERYGTIALHSEVLGRMRILHNPGDDSLPNLHSTVFYDGREALFSASYTTSPSGCTKTER